MGKVGRPLEITLHAIERYQQRVEDVPAAVVVQRLRGPAFEAAAEMGAVAVILLQGHRAVIQGGAIVTVLAKPHHPKAPHNEG